MNEYVINSFFFFAEVLRLYPPVLVCFYFCFPESTFMFYVYVAARSIPGMEVISS